MTSRYMYQEILPYTHREKYFQVLLHKYVYIYIEREILPQYFPNTTVLLLLFELNMYIYECVYVGMGVCGIARACGHMYVYVIHVWMNEAMYVSKYR